MPLSSNQVQTLFALLERSGWSWRDDNIHAINDTMWLNRDVPWAGDLQDFYERMCDRRDRINNSPFPDLDPATDTASLIAVLEAMRSA